MSYVFISYSRKDIAFIQMLASSFRRNGINYWWDIEQISPGTIWDDEIHEGLREAERLIVVISPFSMASDEVGAEWKYAIWRDIPVIPLFLREADIHYRLNRYNYIDFRSSYQTGIEKLIPHLKEPVDIPSSPLLSVDPRTVITHLESTNWHVRRDTVDTLLKMAAGAGIFATLQLGVDIVESIKTALVAHISEENRVSTRKKIIGQLKDTSRRASQNIRIELSDVLPEPFDWIEIPAGLVTLEKGGYLDKETIFNVARFQMAKYPVTNAQYAKFLAADGYSNRDYWTDAGWQAREKEGWTEPRYWQDSKFNGSEQPVVGVSWYEVYAFTQWLSELTGESIVLPTEQQWQRAAQGDEGWVYPWGNEWDGSRCQNSVGGHWGSAGKTTSVTKYEGKGDSPFGVVDMVGNVWEWCLTIFDSGRQDSSGTERRVLRGGSWLGSYSTAFRAAGRGRSYPAVRFSNGGFRCARLYT